MSLRIPGLVLLAIVLASIVIHASSFDINGRLIFIYGTHKCPHCWEFYSWIQENYDPENYYFCDVSENPDCSAYYYKLLSDTGLPGVVPITLIIEGGLLRAILIGGYKNKEFIDSLFSLDVSNNRVNVYVSGEPVGYLEIPRDKNKEFLLQHIPLNTGTTTTTSGGEHGGWNTYMLLAVLGAVFIAVVVLFAKKK